MINHIRSNLKLHIFSSEDINPTVNYGFQILAVLVLASMLFWFQPQFAYSGTGIICELDQITDTTEGDNRTESSSISGDGICIAFDSDSNLTGGNADGNREVFLFNINTNIFTQITVTTVATSGDAAPNADCTRIAFASSADLTGGNADGNQEIFLFNINTSSFTQITSSTGTANLTPRINDDGTRIAFRSRADLTGGNADLNREIFLFDTNTSTLTQITNTTGTDNFNLSINAGGTLIVFTSGQNFTGGNADGNTEVFLFNTNTSTFTQITFTTGVTHRDPVINADGTHIAFESESNLTGGNADGNREIFLFNINTSSFTQITDTTGGTNEDPSINADGTRIAFESSADPTGGNADGNDEIILADCFIEGPLVIIPTIGGWGMIIATLLLGFFAIAALRRRTES